LRNQHAEKAKDLLSRALTTYRELGMENHLTTVTPASRSTSGD
jgi:hypothetical protein